MKFSRGGAFVAGWLDTGHKVKNSELQKLKREQIIELIVTGKLVSDVIKSINIKTRFRP